MAQKIKNIPVNSIAGDFDAGIAIERLQLERLEEAALNDSEAAMRAHREERHSFFLLERGTVHVEIDFQKFEIKPLSVVYMHPDQVHRILGVENMGVAVLAINNENLNPEYLQLLEGLTPAMPLALSQESFSVISETVSLCIKFAERKRDKLYHAAMKDSCNALVGLLLSQYMALNDSGNKVSRYKTIANAFKSKLARNYTQIKSPATYAQILNVSAPYLNECVKNATGYPVSYHIQQRIILEAKRLLYHSDKSVKEISADLGYDDYPYFSRFFSKAAGMTPLTFRNRNLE